MAVLADDVHVVYRVFEDTRPTLRGFIVNRFRRRVTREVHAIRGASLTMARGDAVAVVGRNGSGKSTLLRVLAGLLPPTGGAVYARSRPVLLGVGAVLNRTLSARENVYLGGTALGLSRREVHGLVDEVFAFAGLEGFEDMPLRAYSSGMRSRLQFSLASIVLPGILFVDEVLAVGDAEFRKRSQQRMRELLDAAGTVVIVSHNLRSLRDVCNRALWLDAGRIVADGDIDEVLRAYAQATGDQELA